jgi:hypothetical protein
MKVYGGVDAYIPVFWTHVFVGEWSASGLNLLTPGEIIRMLN